MPDPIQTIREYLRLLETFQIEPALYERILHADFVQTELPNALNKAGQKSDRAEVFRRMGLGKAMLERQRFDVTTAFASGDQAVVEARWTGTLAIDAGALQKGQSITAHFCMVFDMKDGLIWRQRNYDCFDAF
jgi:ketosteroid isomerase-like protein